MGFSIFCSNKGCRKEMEPVVDKDTMICYCSDCGKPIEDISIFMKRQLVAAGKVKKIERKKSGYSVRCNKCKMEGPPELSKDDKLICANCHEELELNKPFAQMVKVNLMAQKRAGEDK